MARVLRRSVQHPVPWLRQLFRRSRGQYAFCVVALPVARPRWYIPEQPVGDVAAALRRWLLN